MGKTWAEANKSKQLYSEDQMQLMAELQQNQDSKIIHEAQHWPTVPPYIVRTFHCHNLMGYLTRTDIQQLDTVKCWLWQVCDI